MFKAKQTVTFAVRMQLPEGATVNEAAEFIRTALNYNFKGGKVAEDYVPMDHLDNTTVRVALQKRVIEYT